MKEIKIKVMQEDKVDDGGIEMKIPKIDIIPVGNNWKKMRSQEYC